MTDYIGLFLGLGAFAGWATHVFTCLATGAWGFLVAGALFFPIGIIHGIGVWFNAW